MWGTLVALVGVVTVSAQDGASPDSRVVNIEQGPVRGYRAPGGPFVFYGIPYATAPTGPHKYRAPLSPRNWTDTLDAVDRQTICPQIQPSENLIIREDCLIANIYVPETTNTNLPVVVFVHGGAYHTGRGTSMNPTTLVINKNIIGVTFNYRIGIHGFLCLGTEDVPGNAGMKDQLALLRWVNKNIARFGGNPNDVTLYGCSAGGASVDTLLLSETTQGLFNKIIAGSGCHLGVMVQIDPIRNAKHHAAELNFTDIDDLQALEEFYKSAPFEFLTSVEIAGLPHSGLIFSPCVERDIGQEMFLRNAPIDIIKSGQYSKVPALYGFTNMEGLMRLGNFERWSTMMNFRFSDFLPIDLEFESEQERDEVINNIKEFYFNNNPVGPENILSYIDYFSDVLFIYSILRSTKLRLENNNDTIFLYEYTFTDDDISTIPYTNRKGAAHCAQSRAIFDVDNENNLTEEYRRMRAVMQELWGNFIITGNPVPENSNLPSWPRVGANWTPYMTLDTELRLNNSTFLDRVVFWEEIYAKYAAIPIPPRHEEDENSTDSATLLTLSTILLWITIFFHLQTSVVGKLS